LDWHPSTLEETDDRRCRKNGSQRGAACDRDSSGSARGLLAEPAAAANDGHSAAAASGTAAGSACPGLTDDSRISILDD
jgi:hypothetical protein